MSKKKDYNEGIKSGLKLSEEIVGRNATAMEFLRDEVSKLPSGFEEIKLLIKNLSDDLNNSELEKLYGIMHIFCVDDMEQDDKTLLMCLITTASLLHYPNEKQQSYSRALRKHLGVDVNDCKSIDNAVLCNLSENIDSIKAQKAMYLVMKEFFYLADNTNDYGDVYNDILKCFLVSQNGTWSDIIINIKVTVFGSDGLIEQYGDGELEESDFLSYHEKIMADINEILNIDDASAEQINHVKEKLLELANQEYIPAICLLADCYKDGILFEQNYTNAVRLYKKASDQNNDEAQFELGKLFANGNGIEQSWDEAFKYYSLASDQGNYKALCNMGYCYDNGLGVRTDINKAIECLKKSSTNEQSKVAPFYLGIIYFRSDKEYFNIDEATIWMELAVKRGNVDAMTFLAKQYTSGATLKCDKEKAFSYLNMAADAGCKDVYLLLGDSYFYGIGIPVDEIKAAEYYENAVKHYENVENKKDGDKEKTYVDPRCLYQYGHCLVKGIGLAKNIEKGKSYINKAKTAGYKISSKAKFSLSVLDLLDKLDELNWKLYIK